VASVGVMLRGKDRLASIGAADRPVAAFAGSPAGFTLMSLRPFVFLTACLLGACERKDASADATLPDHAETRSSLRDEERRPMVTRREREGKVDAVEMIRRLARDWNWPETEAAIKAADPSEFDAIWRALAALDSDQDPLMDTATGARRLQVIAIYHLAAKNDLAAAGRITREMLLPLCKEEERLPVMKGLLNEFYFDEDVRKLGSFFEFMSDVSLEERKALEKDTAGGWISPEQLAYLVGSDQRLSSEETSLILRAFLIPALGESGVELIASEPGMKEIYRDLWETVKEGEKKGVLGKGAGDRFLNFAGVCMGDWYLEVVPPEKLGATLRLEGGDEATEGIVTKDIGRNMGNLGGYDLSEEEWKRREKAVPSTFFTATGIRNLPEERYANAFLVWYKYRSEVAEAWFANASELTPHQRDLIRAGVAKTRNFWDKEESQAWLDQISDAELRERTVREIEEAR